MLQTPPVPCIDGVRLADLERGRVYDVSSLLGCLLVAERWGEPVMPAESDALGSARSERPGPSPSSSADALRPLALTDDPAEEP